MHESEIQVQGNQRFFFLAASRLVFSPLRGSLAALPQLSRSSLIRRKIKKNLWDQGKLGPKPALILGFTVLL